MNQIRILLEELNKLPQGTISEKKIKGKTYYYHQFKQNGKLISKYLKKPELEEMERLIARRKEIEAEIKKIELSGRDMKKPSKRSRDLTGDLMMEDEVVASFENGKLNYIDEQKCPLLIKRTGNIYSFLSARAIDRDRTHSRLLKKYLNVVEDDDAMVSIYSYGATITDNYWFKAKGSKLKYKDIAFQFDYYSDLVLKGDAAYIPKSPKHSPQLTLNGSYEKCWKLIDGSWYLYKQGNDNEIFSELVCSKVAMLLGIPTAEYEYDDGYIRTRNIAEEYNLEPISSIAGDDDSFMNVFHSVYEISDKIAIEYLRLILFDFIVYNVDRHNENCGLFRDKQSGEIIGLAPNYDNNIALLSGTSNLKFNAKHDGLASYLKKFLHDCPEASALLKEVNFNELSATDIQEVFDSIAIKRDEKLIKTYILDRYHYVCNLLDHISTTS